MPDDKSGALYHLRILELGGQAAAYVGHFLAELGADVMKVEPPGGEPERWTAPYASDTAGPDRSLLFAEVNANKRSIVLDLRREEDQRSFVRLARTADAVIESFPTGHLNALGIGYAELNAADPGIVLLSLTPFGQSGPLKAYKGNNAIAEATSGMMAQIGGEGGTPCVSPNDFLMRVAGMHGAYAVLAAIRAREKGGPGQHVDMSLQDVGTHMQTGLAEYGMRRRLRRRTGVHDPGVAIVSTKDGFAFFQPAHPHMWDAFVKWIDDPVLSGPEWKDREFRAQNADVIQFLMRQFSAQFETEKFVEEAQKRGIPTAPVQQIGGFMESPQAAALKSFSERSHPEVGVYPHIDFARLSATPARFRRAAPRAGQDQEDILRESATGPTSKTASSTRSGAPARPLEGVRILDLTRVIAGPLGTQFLGFLGADVIKVESRAFFTGREPGAGFTDINRAKRGITLDVRTPEGLDLALQLAAKSDVIVSNFSAGVMDRLGLGYDVVRAHKPDIVYVSMPGFGDVGPLKDWVAFGPMVQAYSGLTWLWRHPELSAYEAVRSPLADNVSAATLAFVTLTALEHRDRTGEGQQVQVVLLETLASMLNAAFIDRAVNHREPQPQGYASARYAPYGSYPCRGDNAWCVIAVETDDEWRAFQKAVGGPGWVMEARFQTKEGRIDHRQDLDAFIATWTAEYTPRQVMHFLQRDGVPTGMVQNAEDLFYDYHLRARGHIVEVRNPKPWGTFEYQGAPWVFPATPALADIPAPALGQHSEEVFCGLLGMSADEYRRLQQANVIY